MTRKATNTRQSPPALHRIIDLAARLSDKDTAVNIDVCHSSGRQQVTMYIHGGESVMYFSCLRYSVADILGYLELIDATA